MNFGRQPAETRASALWGRKGGEQRGRRHGRTVTIAVVIGLTLTLPVIASAGGPGMGNDNGHGNGKGNPNAPSPTGTSPGHSGGNGNGNGNGNGTSGGNAGGAGGGNAGTGTGGAPSTAAPKAGSDTPSVPDRLLNSAKSHPDAKFRVIVQSSKSTNQAVTRVRAAIAGRPGNAKGITHRFAVLGGVAAELTGRQLVALAHDASVEAITPDARIRMAGYTNNQQWPYQSQLSKFWDQIQTAGVQSPTVAVVDTGVDSTRPDFGNRVVKQVNLSSLTPNSAGDGRGHGTFVAGILAGSQSNYVGGAPNAKIVSLDVMNDAGQGLTSDVIAAADWIYQNKDVYGIRVANFSLHAGTSSSFMYDPLDKAVEKLWFSGVVVVAAAGNYATSGLASGVLYAPGNDPFVITAGAADIEGTIASNDDVNAPWSAYGYTNDGFMKPDVGAPGRYMIGPVPPGSTLVTEKPANVVGSGYMQLSGTSFSAPVVSAAAAYVLAMHPTWTPDQVKGALMATATAAPSAAARSLGLGEVKAQAAATLASPPNPNKALDAFVNPSATGSTPVFDAVSWSNAARTSVSWDAVSWSDVSWSSSAVSWGDVSWSDAAFASVSWADSTGPATADVSWADGAANEYLKGGYKMSQSDYLLVK
jgi:subtilisin family serine protease